MNAEKIKRRRDPLSPKPILDRKLLLKALEERRIVMKDIHLETFYQLLHRQRYPDLKSFVEEYYRNETIALDGSSTTTNIENDEKKIHGLKNPVSSTRKNTRRLPKAFLSFLSDPNNDFVTLTSTIDSRPTSKDGTTTKMAVRLQDGHLVESVLMRHVSEDGSRATLCVSSQVGCAMGCTFCATGTMGIRGNLCQGEILEQLVHADNILAEEMESMGNNCNGNSITSADGSMKRKSEQQLDCVRNIVFMGMGEPLNNYDNVIEACKAMIDRKRWNLGHSKVTVSTVGVTNNMRRLTKELPEVNLALSLHAPNQAMREAIVPTAKTYPIEDMIQALDEHMMALSRSKAADGTFTESERKTAGKRKRAMIEYVMLEGDTSSFECAHQLGKLCENRHLVVNLIPYNQTDVKDILSCPSEEHMKEFQRIVSSYGAFCSIRRTMGADIAGACGQLVVANEKKNQSTVSDIEDGPFQKKQMSSVNVKKFKKRDECHDPKDKWLKPLAICTGIAAACFFASLGSAMLRKVKR
jgi:adenine C2-methylase RlmN of 23S rRNA A2503 and tRNA A37